MTIEQYTIQYLAESLEIGVSGAVPDGMRGEFVTVEKTGSHVENHVRRATLAVQSWSDSLEGAMLLNSRVVATMKAMSERPEISRSALEADYNWTDTSTKKWRYQATFTVVYFL